MSALRGVAVSYERGTPVKVCLRNHLPRMGLEWVTQDRIIDPMGRLRAPARVRWGCFL